MKFLIILLTFGLIYYSHGKELITTSYFYYRRSNIYELENGTVHIFFILFYGLIFFLILEIMEKVNVLVYLLPIKIKV